MRWFITHNRSIKLNSVQGQQRLLLLSGFPGWMAWAGISPGFHAPSCHSCRYESFWNCSSRRAAAELPKMDFIFQTLLPLPKLFQLLWNEEYADNVYIRAVKLTHKFKCIYFICAHALFHWQGLMFQHVFLAKQEPKTTVRIYPHTLVMDTFQTRVLFSTTL